MTITETNQEMKDPAKFDKMIDWLNKVKPGIYPVTIDQAYYLTEHWDLIHVWIRTHEFVFNEEFTHIKKRIK